MASPRGCVQYLQRPNPTRGQEGEQKETLGVENCSVCTANRCKSKEVTAVFILQRRGTIRAWNSGCRRAATMRITSSHTSRCNLLPIIHKRKLRQWYPVEPFHSTTTFIHHIPVFIYSIGGSFLLLKATDLRPKRAASEGEAAGEKQKIPFITSEEPRRFPGTFTVFIINREYAQFSSGWNRHSSRRPEEKKRLNLSIIFTLRSEMFSMFKNLIKKD